MKRRGRRTCPQGQGELWGWRFERSRRRLFDACRGRGICFAHPFVAVVVLAVVVVFCYVVVDHYYKDMDLPQGETHAAAASGDVEGVNRICIHFR